MTREEFIKNYAARSGFDAPYAILGFLDIGGTVRVALPCACKEDGCDGWAMVSAEGMEHHILFYAPEPLQGAYRKTLDRANRAAANLKQPEEPASA
jgi:hypothetical protein